MPGAASRGLGPGSGDRLGSALDKQPIARRTSRLDIIEVESCSFDNAFASLSGQIGDLQDHFLSDPQCRRGAFEDRDFMSFNIDFQPINPAQGVSSNEVV